MTLLRIGPGPRFPVRGCAVQGAKIPNMRQSYRAESSYRHPNHCSQLSEVGQPRFLALPYRYLGSGNQLPDQH